MKDEKMVKKIKNLWAKICTMENIEEAYRKARKGKSKYRAVKYIDAHKEECLKKILKMLVDGTFKTGIYREKPLFEPKERLIYVLPFYPDRIVQHAIMNVLEPELVKRFIKDSYACIKGRGLHKGSLRTMEFVRRNDYCLKMDIRKFYPSVKHKIMKQILHRKIKEKPLLKVLDNIIDSIEGDANVPIGNLTSQWFGNTYMNKLDMFVKHVLRWKDYERYCDDYTLYSNDKKALTSAMYQIKDFLDIELQLELSKCDKFKTTQGIDFLGYRHFKGGYILIRKSTVKRVKKRLRATKKLYLEGKMSHEKFRSIVASTYGWFKWANSHNLSLKLELAELMEMTKYDRRTKQVA